ncbi:MAG: exported protein of unknown function [Frankiales bacterium]|nr:exported protein of unknown function [Frankiales bacterium]
MNSSSVVLELRQPPLSVALFCTSLVVAGVLAAFVVSVGGPLPFTAVFLAFIVGITGYNAATVLSRVRAYADGSLEVRNRFSTRQLKRSDIDRVMVGRQGGFGSLRRVELLLNQGTTVHVVATQAPPFPGQRRLDQQAAELRRWLDGTG